MSERQRKFDRFLIDWADEFIQDLVASFSARRPTMTLRLVVAGLYLSAALHLIWTAILPFFRASIAGLIGDGSPSISPSQIEAFATSIVIGRMSFHLLLVVAYFLLSFVVRASRRWTRAAGTIVLLFDLATSLVGLAAPKVSMVFLVLPWATVTLCAVITVLLWLTPDSSPAATAFPVQKGRLSNGRV